MAIQNTTIDVTCGIYETEYTANVTDDGQLIVKAPFIKWDNNTGTLAFEEFVVGDKERPYVEQLFNAGELVDDDGITLDAYIYGLVSFV